MDATKHKSENSDEPPFGRSFGRFVRRLRRGRGQTQEYLAERAGLSPDTIRRLEHGSFSPSLDTLRSLCRGLDLSLSTLFKSYEVGDLEPAAEYTDMLRGRSDAEIKLVTQVARALLDELDAIRIASLAEDDQHAV